MASNEDQIMSAGPGVYLEKASNELVSHCTCEEALVSIPGQMSCPWCGCGWLFSCMQCRKAFTFARGVRTDRDWDELAREDLGTMGFTEISQDDVNSWIVDMQSLLVGIEPGRRYVFLDGTILPADVGPFRYDGWYAHHELECAPQTAALDEPTVLRELLGNKSYWISNELPDRD